MGRSPESPIPFAPCPTPVEQAQEAVEEEKTIPIPEIRRKSSTWKGFNLKRQLSRVDIKLKKPLREEKRGSIFYADTSVAQDITDADDYEKSSPESDDNTVIDNQSVIDLTTKNQSVKTSEEMSEPIQFSPEDETEMPFIVGSLGAQMDYLPDEKDGFVMRPDNLDIIDRNGAPKRPPRHKKKTHEPRDKRLLSVPNIKLLRLDQQSLKDLRDKEETTIVSPQPSFTGNLMRRFSKF